MKSATTPDTPPPPAEPKRATRRQAQERRQDYPPSPPALLTFDMVLFYYLPVDARTLQRWLSAGEFPRHDIAKGAMLKFWRRETVERWIQEQAEAKGVA